MKKTRMLFWIVALICCFLVAGADAMESQQQRFGTKPMTNAGKKWRIGYYEGGPFSNYYKYMYAMVTGLMDLGWIEYDQIPQMSETDSQALWSWLSTEMKSDFLEMLPDAYYSAQWDQDKREKMREELIDRLNSKKDIDLMLAMGTWAGKDLANDRHSVNTMVISTSDPIGSGIIKSAEDSGFDHLHARVDPYRYERQLRVFHDVIKFKRLGVAYEDSVVGRSYAVLDTIQRVAAERGFEIVSCHTLTDIKDEKEASRSVIECFRELAPKVDAIYVTVQSGVNAESIPELVKITNEYKVPTFSQFGSKEVRYGFLLSISRSGGFRPEGRFLAATFAQICNGAKPRSLNQIFEEAPNIAINLKTAEIIGLYLYSDLLAAADEIYRTIEIPDPKNDNE